MWIVWAALVGLIVGALARLLTPGRTPRGLIVTMVIGVVGSVIATLLGQGAGYYDEGESAGFLASLIGAIAFILVLQAVGTRRER